MPCSAYMHIHMCKRLVGSHLGTDHSEQSTPLRSRMSAKGSKSSVRSIVSSDGCKRLLVHRLKGLLTSGGLEVSRSSVFPFHGFSVHFLFFPPAVNSKYSAKEPLRRVLGLRHSACVYTCACSIVSPPQRAHPSLCVPLRRPLRRPLRSRRQDTARLATSPPDLSASCARIFTSLRHHAAIQFTGRGGHSIVNERTHRHHISGMARE